MPRRYLLSLVAALTLPAGVQAAEVTSIPPWLRGDAAIGYTYGHLSGTLVEEGERVGSRAWEEHLLTWSGAFAAAPGAAVFFEVPQVLHSRLAFPEANEMVFDPTQERGTMLGTDPLAGIEPTEGSAVGGVWLGVRGTPFSEDFEKRPARATWLLEAALRTRNDDHFWQVTDGERGAGPGGSGLRLHTAFSTTHYVSEPYVAFTWERNGAYTADLLAEDGSVLAPGVELEAADAITVRAGTELVAQEDEDTHSRFAVDLRLAWGYRTWQTVPSGVLLPSVLSTSRSIPVTEGEYTWVQPGIGFYYRMFQYMQLDVLADVAWIAPHRLEHPYPVLTGGDTLDVHLGVAMKILLR